MATSRNNTKPRMTETLHAQDLKSYTDNGAEWYKSYAGRRTSTHKLLIMPSIYPNPLLPWVAIQPRKMVFDDITESSKRFYEAMGLKVFVIGPQGLGATAGLHDILTEIVQWIYDNRIVISLMKPFYSFAKLMYARYQQYADDRRMRNMRQIEPNILLQLRLYINEGEPTKDLVPYAQQLVATTTDLMRSIKYPYVNTHIDLSVLDVYSDKSISIAIGDSINDKRVARLISKLDKVKPSSMDVHLS